MPEGAGEVDAAAAAGLPAFLSDPFREQRVWVEGHAFSHFATFGVIEVVGADAAAFLTALWAQRLDSLAVRASTEALLLDASGHVEAQAAVVRESDESFVLIVEPGDGERVATWLDSMRFMMRVEVRDVTADWSVLALSPALARECHLRGDEHGAGQTDVASGSAGDVLRAAARVVWHDPWARVADGGAQYSGENPARTDYQLALVVVARDRIHQSIAALASTGALQVGWGAVDAIRIEAWRPRFGAEGDDRLLPHEVDWLRTAVHLAKGCYRGQETVAKVHNLGHPPRRLVFLHLDGSDDVLPVRGDDVVDGGDTVVGRVTSAARHWESGPIALAIVRRGLDIGASLEVRHDGVRIAARQEVIVPPEAGGIAQADVAALRAARRGGSAV